jgi:integrase
LVVAYLNRLMPLEGGLYEWARLAFGDAVGFMTVWNIWLSFILQVSQIALVTTTYVSYAMGPDTAWIATNKSILLATSAALLAMLMQVAGAGKATVNRDTSVLSSSMSRARKMRLILQNPCRDVGKLNERRDRRQAKPLSYEEEARIQRFSSPWLSTLVSLLVETGLRARKEALPLKWSDISLDSEPAYIHVRDSKSAAGLRTVWLTSHCREVLSTWRSVLGPDFSAYVFPSARVPTMHITDYKGAWQRAAAAAGLRDRRIHDLRATFASRANGCRASGLTVAHLLGHASTQILPTYVKPLDENTKQ